MYLHPGQSLWPNPGLWHTRMIQVFFDIWVCGGCLNIQALTVSFMWFLKYFGSLYALYFQSTSFSDLAMIFFWKDCHQKDQMQVFRGLCSADVIGNFLKKQQARTSWNTKRKDLKLIICISSQQPILLKNSWKEPWRNKSLPYPRLSLNTSLPVLWNVVGAKL